VKEWTRADELNVSTKAYGHAIRWGEYDTAIALIREPEGKEKKYSYEELKKIKVTDYELLQRTPSSDLMQAVQVAEIQYYRVDQMKEKSLIDSQLWEYDLEEKRWYLTTGLPDFK
jgi:hypothetical protein